MRVISLNAWCGRSLHMLMRFLEREAVRTDVFCLQEVYDTTQAAVDCRHPSEYVCGDLYRRMECLLSPLGFSGQFATRPGQPDGMSQAMFWKSELPKGGFGTGSRLVFDGHEPVYRHTPVPTTRMAQYLSLERPGCGWLHIINYHGLWNGGGKRDCPERLEQSRCLNRIAADLGGSTIICGDLNLDPDTESLRLLAEGRRSLVVEFGIDCTRTPLYRNFGDPAFSMTADYMFISPDLKPRLFEVMPDLVSDHAPLLLEIE